MAIMLPTPDLPSPYRLAQEALRAHPWALLAFCLLCARSRAGPARRALGGLLARWPDPASLAMAAPAAVAGVIHGVGMERRRAERLAEMSGRWRRLVARYGPVPPLTALERLRGCGVGAYATDSYGIWVSPRLLGPMPPRSGDDKLRAFWAWAREVQGHPVPPELRATGCWIRGARPGARFLTRHGLTR